MAIQAIQVYDSAGLLQQGAVSSVNTTSPLSNTGTPQNVVVALTGIVDLAHGGTGADLSAGGPGVLIQATSGAAITSATAPADHGGTGQTTYLAGDILYASNTTTLAKLGIGAAATYLRSTGSAPAWHALDMDDASAGTLAVARGGTAIASYIAGDMLYASGTTTLSKLALGTAGYFLKAGASAPGWAQIDHGADLVGLADDDHTQYALLAGRAGGQTLNGGTAASNNLALQSTANATKGNITSDSHIVATSDNAIDLGTTSLFYRAAYSYLLTLKERTAPASPAASSGAIYFNNNDHMLHSIDSSGIESTLNKILVVTTDDPYIAPAYPGAPTLGNSALVASANEVRTFLFMLPVPTNISKFAFSIGATSSGKIVGVGIYNTAGTTRIMHGEVTLGAGTGVYTGTFTGAGVLQAGMYLVAWTCDSTVPTVLSFGAPGSAVQNLLNAHRVNLGTAANTSASGVVPTTTSTLTSANIPLPFINLAA